MFKKILVVASLIAASFAVNATVITSETEYQIQQYYSSLENRSEINVIGIYGSVPNYGNNHFPYIVNVFIEGTKEKPLNLVLSSYEPVLWIFSGSGTNQIDSILLNGLYESNISGLSNDVEVINKSGNNYITPCSINWPEEQNGCYTTNLITEVESIYGDKINSFTGIYYTTNFTINLNSVSQVPEPTTGLLTLAGLCGIIALRKKNDKE